MEVGCAQSRHVATLTLSKAAKEPTDNPVRNQQLIFHGARENGRIESTTKLMPHGALSFPSNFPVSACHWRHRTEKPSHTTDTRLSVSIFHKGKRAYGHLAIRTDCCTFILLCVHESMFRFWFFIFSNRLICSPVHENMFWFWLFLILNGKKMVTSQFSKMTSDQNERETHSLTCT